MGEADHSKYLTKNGHSGGIQERWGSLPLGLELPNACELSHRSGPADLMVLDHFNCPSIRKTSAALTDRSRKDEGNNCWGRDECAGEIGKPQGSLYPFNG